jgi:hypothetical protein
MRNQANTGNAAFVFLLLFLMSIAGSASSSVASAFPLQIPIEGRALGMGGLGCALITDFGEMGSNPGNLILHRGVSVTVAPKLGSINQLVPDLADDIYYGYTSLRVSAPDLSFVRPHIWILRRYLDYGERTSFPGGIRHEIERTEAVGLGLTLFNQLGIGYVEKNIQLEIMDQKPRGRAIDYGVTWMPKTKLISGDLLLGLSWLNIGDAIGSFNSESDGPLPRYFRYGFSYQGAKPTQGPGGPWIWTVGLESTELQVPGGHRTSQMGFEFRGEMLAFRGGYIHDPDGDVTDFTFGVGIVQKVFDLLAFRLDIANHPQASELDRTWKGSISFQLHPQG